MDLNQLNQVLAPFMPNTQLTAQEAQLLHAITVGGVTRGSIAMRRARLTPDEMVAASQRLLAVGLVRAEGNVSDDVEVQYAMFSPAPSKLPLLERGLNLTVR